MVRKWAERYERRGIEQDLMLYPAPGFFVDLGGRRVHVRKQGEAGPPVILEAGIAASSLSWSLVDRAIGEFARVYS